MGANAPTRPLLLLRRNLMSFYKKLDPLEVAAQMGIDPNRLSDYVRLKAIPAPDVFMSLLAALQVSSESRKTLGYWYIQVLARRTRTSSIPVHRFPQTGLPDPYGASSVETLVQKL